MKFIKQYKNRLSNESCDYIMKLMTIHNDLTNEGNTIHGVDKRFKISTDLNLMDIVDKDEHLHINIIPEIRNAILQSLLEYNREHPVIPGGKVIVKYSDQDLGRLLEEQTILDTSLLCKKYPKGEGFFDWHIDNGDGWKNNARILVLMFYLNDVEEGGQTEFDYQDFVIKPEKGTLVIFPTDWMHLHRGKMPISNDKYILNSWLLRMNPMLKKILKDEGNI